VTTREFKLSTFVPRALGHKRGSGITEVRV